MSKTTNHNHKAREESRIPDYFPRKSLTIKPVDKAVKPIGALLIDSNNSGMGIVTSLYLPIGTLVEIKDEKDLHVFGEVVDIREEFDEWDWNGMLRMSLRLIEKVD